MLSTCDANARVALLGSVCCLMGIISFLLLDDATMKKLLKRCLFIFELLSTVLC